MKNNVKLKGRLRTYLQTSLYLGFLLIVIDIVLYLIDYRAGIVITCFLVFYMIIILFMMFYNKPVIMNEMVSFATQYGQIQRRLLRELDLPYALTDEDGKIIWTNIAFEKTVHKEKGYKKSITTLFPAITKERLPGPEDEDEIELTFDFEDRNYSARLKKISLKSMAENSDIISARGYDGYLIALYLYDETALQVALREVDDQSLAVGLIYLDNYEEALESVEEVRRSLLIALIDRKVNKYIASIDGICKKLEKDKYLVVLRKKAVTALEENRFDLLEDVKTVNIGNEMAVTVSIGVGLNGLTYAQNYEFARNAIDLALGRGGDQAIVKTPDNVIYYGGKSQQVEKSTRVKARVKAQALREIISLKDDVYVMGHRNLDADSFGAAVGIYRIAKALEKQAHIVLSDVPSSMQPMVDVFANNSNYEPDMMISGTQALEMVNSNAVLVVVDVNKPSITECPELLRRCKSIVVLDHHRQGAEIIENATLSYIEAYASSACELVSEILQYITDHLRLRQEEADSLYAGIMIDTNNFTSKIGVRTFEAAAFLRRNGADVTRIRKLFREDADDCRAKADTVSRAEIYRQHYAISYCAQGVSTVVGAQAANELLNIKGVRASFILTPSAGQIYVSARSMDEVNVQVIMERMGGGGHLNMAGAQLTGISMEDAIMQVRETIDNMIAQGEIS